MLRRLLWVVVGLVGAWIVACLVLFVWPPAETGAPARADAVVVLAGGLNARLDPALALMRKRVAPVLVVSGAHHGTRWKKARRLCGGAYRVRYRVLCPQPQPYSTQGEARMIGRLARAHGWSRVVVVTSTFHVTRAKMLVRRCYPNGLWLVATHVPWWRYPEAFVAETGKLVVQFTIQRGC